MRIVRPQFGRGRSHRRALAVALLAVLVTAAVPAAQAYYKTGKRVAVAGNPADALAGRPMDPEGYDSARGKCDARKRAGTQRLVAWLQKNFRAPAYGVYRCDGGLHSENRAIDWMLDHRIASQRRTGERLIKLLLAPDAKGKPRALARRMGVQELIWNCGYWSTSASRAGKEFQPYSACNGGHPDPTQGHIDHIHIGVSILGSLAKTSFWTSNADGAAVGKTVGSTPPTTVSPGGGTSPG
jgi:hypothetical protein